MSYKEGWEKFKKAANREDQKFTKFIEEVHKGNRKVYKDGYKE